MAEKLFNLPISKFPELIVMEESNKRLDIIYNIFKEHQNQVKEWSLKPWSKLDIKELTTGADDFFKKVNGLPRKNPGIDQEHPYIKLKQNVTGFKESVPLIEKLKIPAIQDRHWKKIMEKAGIESSDINLKTITLANVFELELQKFESDVDEIVTEAS